MPNNVLTRTDTNETIELPQDMQWVDEFDWSDLAQANPRYTRAGALVIQQSTKLAGRPITLAGEWVWINRGDLKKLKAWSNVAKLKMSLTLNSVTPAVVAPTIFRVHDGALDCEPVNFETPESDNAQYTGEIRLMII